MKKLSLLFAVMLFNFYTYADIDRFRWDPYSTHQPVLYAAAISTNGPIIEFGCGYGSTDLLHQICEKNQRILISIDDDLSWLEKFSSKYLGKGYNIDNSGWHKFYFVPGKNLKDNENPAHWVKFLNEFSLLNEMTFDVCFIDQSPWLARYESFKKMKDKARFFVIHDAQCFPHKQNFNYEPYHRHSEEFDYHDSFMYYKIFSDTLIGSNVESTFPQVDFSKNIKIE